MIIAFSGHRPHRLGGYSDDILRSLVQEIRAALRENSVSLAYTGMALGWDTAAAIACWKENVPFIAAVPFPEQSLRWPALAKSRHAKLLRLAKEVHVLKHSYSPAALMYRNCWMIERSHSLWVKWDGQPSGGTYQCVQYATRKGLTIHRFHHEFYMGAK